MSAQRKSSSYFLGMVQTIGIRSQEWLTSASYIMILTSGELLYSAGTSDPYVSLLDAKKEPCASERDTRGVDKLVMSDKLGMRTGRNNSPGND